MRQFVTQGIILARTDFGEADRILTVLTPDHGKLRAMAKGSRRSRSKLAGGIELFSVSDLSFIKGRGEIYTLTSSRMQKHFAKIVTNLDRTTAGYELLKLLDRATEDAVEAGYFNLLKAALEALDDSAIELDLIRLWFAMQLLKLSGHAPNLRTDAKGQPLSENGSYGFSFDRMSFQPAVGKSAGRFSPESIKFLRLGFSNHSPRVLRRINDLPNLIKATQPLVQTILRTYVRI